MAPPISENPRGDLRSAPAASAATGSEVTLSDAVTTVRKRKYVIIAFAFMGLLYGFYKGNTQLRLYTAQGRIEIRNGSSNQFRIGISGESGGRLPTEVIILKSDTLLFTVAQDLDLADNPDFLGLKRRPSVHANYADPALHESIVAQLSGILAVSPVNKTDLIVITARTLNPKLSADIVNKLIDEYIVRSFESRVQSTNRASVFLTKQLEDLKHQVENSQAQVIDLQKRLGVNSLDPGHNEITTNLVTLTSAAGSAEITRILAESRYRVLLGMDRNALDQTVANADQNVAASHLSNLRSQRDSLTGDYAKLTSSKGLGPEHPQVIALHAQLTELNKQILDEEGRVIAQAKETLVAAQANEAATRGALEAEKSQADKLRDDLVDYGIRQREFESERSLYESLLERLRTASVQAGLESTEIEIIDQAMPPSSASMDSVTSFMTTNAFTATIIGLIIAFILESLDSGLRSVADIESVSGLPSLALIPRSRRTGVDVSNLSIAQRNVGALSSPKSQFTEAFRALRTSLLLSTPGGLPKVILFTSATPSEGKTTVSVNLACVLAQNNVRVLMIDGDLRRPTIHHRLGLNGKVGLTSVLTGTSTLEQAVQNLAEIPNLDILVSGPVPPFPTEMLGSETMTNLLNYCKGIYTHIVIDSPPLLSVTDGVVLAASADAVVLIVRHGRSGKQTVRRARDLLVRSNAPVTGVAINAVDLSSPEYYGYYGYSVYAGYGSSTAESSAWSSQSGSDRPDVSDPKHSKDTTDQKKRRNGRPGMTILLRMLRRNVALLAFAFTLSALTLPGLTLQARAQFNGPGPTTQGALNQPQTITVDQALLNPGPRDPVLMQGDTISVRLFGEGDFSPTVVIGTDGKVMLPLIGVVSLDQLTITAAENLIADRLRSGQFYKDPQVTVSVSAGPSANVTIIGDVHGIVPITGTRRLLDILALSGGLPPSASHVITINRPGTAQPIVVDLGTDPATSTAANIPIFPGDTVVVAHVGVVYLLGDFKVSGTIPLTTNTPLTLLEATSLGGGTTFPAKFGDLRLIRTVGNRRTVVKLNLKRVMYGKDPDPILQPNDILFLPDSFIKAAVSNGSVGTILGLLSVSLSTIAYVRGF